MSVATAERVVIEGPAGALEAVVEMPIVEVPVGAQQAAATSGYAIVCHPHPLYGGTMENKVVTSIARALRDAGMPTVRFNFRGVGGSAGAYDDGNGETDDAVAVAHWCARRWPLGEPTVAGFSFGAYVGWRLSQQRRCKRLITVAPPVQRFDFTHADAPECPWLVIQGDADEVVDPQGVFSWVGTFDPQPRMIVMPGVGHFFHGRLLELRESIAEAIRSH